MVFFLYRSSSSSPDEGGEPPPLLLGSAVVTAVVAHDGTVDGTVAPAVAAAHICAKSNVVSQCRLGPVTRRSRLEKTRDETRLSISRSRETVSKKNRPKYQHLGQNCA